MLACALAGLQSRHLMLTLLFGVTLLRINQIVTLVSFALDRLELVDRAHLLKLGGLMLDGCVV